MASIAQTRSDLALGNVVGSSISNSLGAFALGLLFHSGRVTFDRSSKIYTAVLLGITTLFATFLVFFPVLKNIAGPLLILLFVVYIVSIGYSIYRGVMTAPEDSDSDSDTDSDSDDHDDDIDLYTGSGNSNHDLNHDSNSDIESDATLNEGRNSGDIEENRKSGDGKSRSKNNTLLNTRRCSSSSSWRSSSSSRRSLVDTRRFVSGSRPKVINKRPKSLTSHVLRLFLGFIAVTVSGFVLSHSIGNLGDELGLSGNVVGITFLSLATTLPEKFISVMSGVKGQGGIVVANTAGSNIFLLTLCAGILFIGGDKSLIEKSFHFAEVGVMWASAVALTACVFIGADRRVGMAMLALYVLFLVGELTFLA